MKIKNSIISLIVENFTLAIFATYFFFWSQSIFLFDARQLLILLVPSYFFLKNETINKHDVVLFSLIIVFLTLHLIFNNIFLGQSFFKNFNAIIGSVLISVIVIMYKNFILKNLYKIIYLFISVLFFTFLFEIIILGNSYTLAIIGGMKMFNTNAGDGPTSLAVSINNFDCLNGWFSLIAKIKLFDENSHFGMVGVAIITYLIFNNNGIKYNFLNCLIILFIFLFLSTTLLVGTIVSLSYFLVIKFKLINNYQKILGTCVLIICFFLIISKEQCHMRITETLQGLYINYKTYMHPNKDPQIRINWIKSLPKNANHFTPGINQSTEVALNSYSVSVNSLVFNPFGIGLNNYKMSYDKYSKQLSLFTWNVNQYDGSNNFSKLLTEFGIFSLFLFISLFYYSLTSFKNFNESIFFFTIIITQMLRGAGYFNGGFLFSLFIILSLMYSEKKKIVKQMRKYIKKFKIIITKSNA